ncbi:MAG: hypothetical protein KGL95_15460 [Patescibacteria group bacterium]|nr:hypothetical protein [Patescibacteria group bacterium]
MAYHKQKHREHKFGLGKTMDQALKLGSSFVPFFSQITQKDIEAINAQSTAPIDFMDQLKNTANIISGRITGYNPFPHNYQVKATRNVAGIFNGWTFLGIGLTAIGRVTKNSGLVPHAAKMEAYGKRIMISGAVGGFFDDNKFGGKQIQQKPVNNFRAMRTPDQLSGNGNVIPSMITPSFSNAGYYSGASVRLSQ